MFDSDDEGHAMLAPAEGKSPREAGELVGVGTGTVHRWAAGLS